jgi:hypothetical protein
VILGRDGDLFIVAAVTWEHLPWKTDRIWKSAAEFYIERRADQ